MNAPAPTLACDAGPRHEAFLSRGTAGLVESHLVQIRSSATGTVVRVRSGSTGSPAR